MVDSAVAVADSIDPLRKWIGRRTPGDGAADAIVVVDVADRGMIHLHVVVFGVTPAAFDRDDVARYWHERRGHGYVVDVAPIERRGCRWVFGDHSTAGTERGRYPRSYLGEMLYRFGDVADADPDTIHRADGRGWWKVALLWATGLPLFTASRSLRESQVSLSPRGTVPDGTRSSVGPTRSHRHPRRRGTRPTASTRGLDPPTDDAGRDGPHVARYRFVGIAWADDRPGDVWRRAAVLSACDGRGRPPPPTGTDAGAATTG